MALLLLARGRAEAARAMIERALEEGPDDIARVRLLPALGEIALATGDSTRAGEAVARLAAAPSGAPGADARGARSPGWRGRSVSPTGDAREALHRLRAAESIWHELDAPYDLACVRARPRAGTAGTR